MEYDQYIFSRDNHACVLCKRINNLEVHHIVFRSQGGTHSYKNLVTLCRSCHANKAHGYENRKYADQLLSYVCKFETPNFWDYVIKKVEDAEYKSKEKKRKAAKSYRDSVNNSYKEKYGCSFYAYKSRTYRGWTFQDGEWQKPIRKQKS